MPSPKHKCARPDCETMLARKEATHCRKHVPRTAEWVARQAAATRGKQWTDDARQRASEARRGSGGTARICEWCKAPFEVEKPSKKARFCSSACGYANRSGTRAPTWNPNIQPIKCATCDVEFRPTNSTASRTCCSMRCAGIHKKRSQRNKRTNIEILMADALAAAGFEFTEQHVVPSVGIPDFFIPATNVIIFCDGDYWHSMPHHVRKDAEQTAKLQALGYTVFRFWGKDIIASPGSCASLLPRASASGTSGI